jgi:hypothetical protein
VVTAPFTTLVRVDGYGAVIALLISAHVSTK